MSNINDYGFVRGDVFLCKGCMKTLSAEHFKMLSDSIRSEYCQDCLKAILNVRRSRVRFNSNMRHRRLEKSSGAFKEDDKQKYISIYGRACAKCGSDENIEFDHIIPVSVGGMSNFHNMQILCLRCNSEKGTSIVDYRDRKRLSGFFDS